MMIRNNINPLEHLTYRDVIEFEKILNPSGSEAKREEWKKNYFETFKEYLLTGVNMPMEMKKNFCVLLMIFPFKDNEAKTFLRLNQNQKVGYMSKYLIKKARLCKIPETIINRYKKTKTNYSRYKGSSLIGFNKIKSDLTKYTYLIIHCCFEKSTRNGKLDVLLED